MLGRGHGHGEMSQLAKHVKLKVQSSVALKFTVFMLLYCSGRVGETRIGKGLCMSSMSHGRIFGHLDPFIYGTFRAQSTGKHLQP